MPGSSSSSKSLEKSEDEDENDDEEDCPNLILRRALSRNHAVGQASRLSLTLNNRLEAVFLKLVGSHQKMKGNFQMETGATPVLRKLARVSRDGLRHDSGSGCQMNDCRW